MDTNGYDTELEPNNLKSGFAKVARIVSKSSALSRNTLSSDSEDVIYTLPPPKCVIRKTEKKTKSVQEELNDIQEIKKWMSIRRSFVSTLPEITPLSLDEKDVAELMGTMVCSDCDKIPSPHRRFLCPRGHHFCYDCGSSRFKLNVEGIGTGICLKKAEPGDTAKPIRGIGYGSIHPEMKLDDCEIEQWIKNKKTGRVECRLFLRKRNPDPLYTALFNNATWECPLKILGCEELIVGKEVQPHIVNCLGKLSL